MNPPTLGGMVAKI